MALVVEIGLLLTNVTARYVFGNPLVLCDELSSVVFLWLAMLGAVVALREGGHMRMSAAVNRAPQRTRRLLERVSDFAIFAFLAVILLPAPVSSCAVASASSRMSKASRRCSPITCSCHRCPRRGERPS